MKNFAAFLLLAFSASAVNAQTGFPFWSSFETSGFDAVNRQNLNVNFAIPLVSTPSRAGNFNYTLVYDSLVWTRNGSSWSPLADANGNPTWGWKDNQALGATKYLHNSVFCDSVPPTSSPHYFNFSYTDGGGTQHKFGLNFYTVATVCQFNTGPRTGYALDGSGYYIDATGASAPVVYSPSGDKITGSSTDANGNYVSGIVVSGSETDYKDTNGRVTLKKIVNSSTQTQYQILDQNGLYSNAVATATYTSMNIKTNFACTGVSDYTHTGIYLITQLALPNGQSYSFSYEPTPNFSGYVTGRLKKVTLPTGGYVQYDYPATPNNGVNCSDGTVTSLTRTVNDGTSSNVWTFSSTGSGTQTTETYPQLPYDSAANVSTFTFSGGQLTSEIIKQGSSTALRSTTISYAPGGGNTSVTATTTLQDGSTKTQTVSLYDSNNNLLSRNEFAWGTGAPGSSVRQTTISYLTGTAYTTANILNRVKQILVKDGSGSVKARTDITYDDYNTNPMTCVTGALQHNDGSYGCSFTTRGNPTSISRYTDAATPSGGITTNLFYDSLGNVVKSDVGGVVQQQSNFTSTTQYAFPDSVTLGPSTGPQLTTSATYNSNTGLIATSTDANNQVTHYTYDNLRRLTDTQRPDNAHLTYAYDDVNKKVTFTSPVQGTDVQRQISYLDSLGRVYKTAVADVSNTTYSIVQSQFDALGRAYKTSNPHNSVAQYWTEVDTDALGRITKRISPDGTNITTYSYGIADGNAAVTATDPAGPQNKQELDALGRLVTVYEPDVTNGNSLTQATTYTYDTLDDLTLVTQGAETRSASYDSLRRTSSVTFPETGSVSYLYNSFDQLTQRTDARGVITTYSYDTLNRPYQVVYNVGSTGVPATPTVTYTFGTTPVQFNNGRLITLATAGVETDTFTYDLLGRTTSASKNVTGAKTYNLSYGHNLGGELSTLTYPSGRVMTQTYDAIGRLSQLNDGVRTYANTFSYNPAQQVLGYTAGNGVQGTFGYSAPLLQLQTLSYAKSGSTLLSLGYGYTQPNGGNNGQITSITDNLTSANSLTFTYDALGRLTRGVTGNLTSPNTWDISWVYDRYGNRTNQTQNGGTLAVTNSNLTFNANNQPTGGFSFDLSGNTLDDGVTHNYVYDAENRYAKLATTLVNTYDAAGLRVEKVTSGSTNVYVFAGGNVIAEYTPSAQTTAPTKEYVYLGGQLLATLDSSGTPTYRHPDLLSARVFTNNSGTSIGTYGHLPFGETWYSTGTVDKWKFTSYERDTDTSLDYARMRFDSARLARFGTPDPYAGSMVAGDPQSWNRYTYARNEPVDFVDPLGLSSIDTLRIKAPYINNDDHAFLGNFGGCPGLVSGVPVDCRFYVSPEASGGMWCDAWSGCGNTIALQNGTVVQSKWVAGNSSSTPTGYTDDGIPIYSTSTGYWAWVATQSWPSFTIQIGLNFSGRFFGPAAGSVFSGIAIDSHGHVATYGGGGGGAGIGGEVSLGVQLGISNGNSVCALGGPFGDLSVSGGAGLAGSADYFYGLGDAPGGVVQGAALTLGGGGGGAVAYQITGTHVAPLRHTCVNGQVQ
jgi:RHS repeat-associated protein